MASENVRGSMTRFVETVTGQRDLFATNAPITIARAPGRLDVMGGIADYSGSLVLELPLAAATYAAAQLSGDRRVVVRTLTERRDVTIALDAIAPAGNVVDYEAARATLSSNAAERWAAYVVGALVVLARERAMSLEHGMRILVDSEVPAGKGVASSAALEVAAMRAIADACRVPLDGRELGVLAQMVENLVVGAPCGVMDQMTAACGEQDRLLALLCQPAELVGQVAIPPSLELWGVDSGIRHEVGGSDYGAVRVGAFMGYRIVAELADLEVQQEGSGRVRIEDDRWHGYLANVSPTEWKREFRPLIPERMPGEDFLMRYGGITDVITRVDPGHVYAVRHPAEHPIEEHARVTRFRSILERGSLTELDAEALGELMYQSHASYGACGLGSSGTDLLVELVRSVGARGGLYGAKITGGGSGGTVAVLARRDSNAAVREVANRYRDATGRSPSVLGGSSPGAMGVSTLTL